MTSVLCFRLVCVFRLLLLGFPFLGLLSSCAWLACSFPSPTLPFLKVVEINTVRRTFWLCMSRAKKKGDDVIYRSHDQSFLLIRLHPNRSTPGVDSRKMGGPSAKKDNFCRFCFLSVIFLPPGVCLALFTIRNKFYKNPGTLRVNSWPAKFIEERHCYLGCLTRCWFRKSVA